jgi:hypothetical protein
MAIYTVEWKGEKYEIEIPHYTSPHGYIDVKSIHLVETGGIVSGLIRELGGDSRTRFSCHVKDELRNEVILACGWKFSQSQYWRCEWDYLYRKAGGHDSDWGEKKAERV